MRILFRTFVVGVVTALSVLAASRAWAQAAPDPAGHWEGTITAPLGQIDFELDVTRDAGVLTGAYSQKAQGLRGLPLSKVTFEDHTLTFVLLNGGPGGGVFRGELLPDGKSISGEVAATNGTVPFTLYRTGAAAIDPPVKNAAVSKALEGTWTGTLDAGGRQIALILKIENRADGSASVVIAQADRPALELPAVLKETGASVALDVKVTSGSWAGTLNAGGTELAGTWSQQGGSLPLAFHRAP